MTARSVNLGPVFLVGAGQTLATGAMTPLIPLFAASLGGRPTDVGLVAAASAVLPLLFGIWMGAAVDRVGARMTCIGGAVALSGAAAVLGSARSVAWLIAGNAIAGLANMMLIVSIQASVAMASTSRTRDRNFGYFAFWISVGHLIGPILGGLLADRISIRAAFLAASGLALVPGLIALAIPSIPAVAADTTSVLGRSWGTEAYRSAWGLMKRSDLRFLMLVGFVILFAWSIKTSFYPLYLQSVGMSAATIGLTFSVFGAAQMVVRPLIGLVTERYGREWPLLASLALAAAAMLATPFLHQFASLALAAVGTGVAFGFTQPVTMSMMAGSVAPSVRGLALGTRMTINRLAEIISPLLFGAMIGVAGLRSAFFLSAAALVIGIWITARGGLAAVASEGARSDTAAPSPRPLPGAAPPVPPSP